jgi:hypothetical protein
VASPAVPGSSDDAAHPETNATAQATLRNVKARIICLLWLAIGPPMFFRQHHLKFSDGNAGFLRGASAYIGD